MGAVAQVEAAPLGSFEQCLSTIVCADPVLGTPVVQVKTTGTGRVLLRLQRFDWRIVLERMEQAGFRIDHARVSKSTSDGSFSMGVVLLGIAPVHRRVAPARQGPRRAAPPAANSNRPAPRRVSGTESDLLGDQLALQSDFGVDPDLSVLLAEPGLAEAKRVLVLGFETSAYVARLSSAFPDKSFRNVELSTRLLGGGDSGQPTTVDVNQIDANVLGQYDFVFAQATTQFVNSLDVFLAAASALVAPGGVLVNQDAQDAGAFMFPLVDVRRDLLDRMDDQQRKHGVTGRGVYEPLEVRARKFGFDCVRGQDLAHRATDPSSRRGLAALYANCYHVASALYGADVDVERGIAALESWGESADAYGQLGTRLSFLRRRRDLKPAPRRAYKQDARSWDRQLTLQDRVLSRVDLKHLQGLPEWHAAQRVLDIGCGNGALLSTLCEGYPAKEYVGIDVNEELVERATGCAPANVSLVRADLHREGVRSLGRFDFAIARLLLQHLPSLDRFLAAAADLVEPGGVLYVHDVNDALTHMEPDWGVHREVLGRLEKAQLKSSVGRLAAHLVVDHAEAHGFRHVASTDVENAIRGEDEARLFEGMFRHVLTIFPELAEDETWVQSVRERLDRWHKVEDRSAILGIRLVVLQRVG